MVAVICGVFGKAPFGVALEVVEHPVEVVFVEDEAHALLYAHQAGEPHGLPGAAFDADVGHRFLLREAAFHGSPLNSMAHAQGLAAQEPGPLICSQTSR